MATGLATAGSAQAVTHTIEGAPGSGGTNSFPFGQPNGWTPNLIWVYKNIPAFQLQPGDQLAFDLQQQNETPIQVEISLASATTNGGDVPTGAFIHVVPNTQTPADPDGDTTTGNYELAFTATAAFNFGGGGLIMRISEPGGAFLGDAGTGSVFLNNAFSAANPANFFVKRIQAEPDGVYPWGGTDGTQYIAGFRLTIADPPAATMPTTITPTSPATPAPAKKRCKKKRKGAAAKKKKCKRRKRR